MGSDSSLPVTGAPVAASETPIRRVPTANSSAGSPSGQFSQVLNSGPDCRRLELGHRHHREDPDNLFRFNHKIKPG